MANKNFGHLVSFLFGIANDCLVDVYDVGDYRKIILPMMIIRRFDAVLEPTKKAVLEMKAKLDAAGILDQDDVLIGEGRLRLRKQPLRIASPVRPGLRDDHL